MWGCFDNCVGVLIMCLLAFTLPSIVCTLFLYCFVYVEYIYSSLFCLYWCKNKGSGAYYGKVFQKLLLNIGKIRTTFQNTDIKLFD